MGVSAASIMFEAWGWLFREQQIEDYGIDAHVEPMDDPEHPSRQLSGNSVGSHNARHVDLVTCGFSVVSTRCHQDQSQQRCMFLGRRRAPGITAADGKAAGRSRGRSGAVHGPAFAKG
jgi:hypothetical protein